MSNLPLLAQAIGLFLQFFLAGVVIAVPVAGLAAGVAWFNWRRPA